MTYKARGSSWVFCLELCTCHVAADTVEPTDAVQLTDAVEPNDFVQVSDVLSSEDAM